MPMRFNPEAIITRWTTLEQQWSKNGSSVPAEVVAKFVNAHFLEAGSDLDEYVPRDWQENPAFLTGVAPEYKKWATDLNALWKTLGREVSDSVRQNPQRHSFVPRHRPMIVPGGRFRESYYWDSLWIVKGLLVCEMVESAVDVIENLLDDIELWGFVPNGARIYYTDRSQPPVLSEMVKAVLEYDRQAGEALLTKAWKPLNSEYEFWMRDTKIHHDGHALRIEVNGTMYTANRYHSSSYTPRPESYAEDVAVMTTATSTTDDDAIIKNDNLMNAIRAGAETGWDFSSRFIDDTEGSRPMPLATAENYESLLIEGSRRYKLTGERASTVVPVDLNSIMLRFETNMASFCEAFEGCGEAEQKAWSIRITEREALLSEVLWNEALHRWSDLDSNTLTHIIKCAEYSADGRDCAAFHAHVAEYAFPLWAIGADRQDLDTDRKRADAVESFKKSGLLDCELGPLTSTITTGQQWDAPNIWAPLVLISIEGLRKSDSSEFANAIATEWLQATHTAYIQSGYMFEKYNAFAPGETGGGGEYQPQQGFGWTNGVTLFLLDS
jgi:alpha,alpha-trehalase